MYVTKLILYFGLILSLIGCTSNQDSESAKNGNQDVEFTKISTNDFMDQKKANQAKQFLSKHQVITSIKAVNSDKDLVVAIEVHHNNRFQLAELRKKFSKELKKKFPKLDTELSTDKKIVLELDRLEKEIEGKNISNKKLKKELKHVIKLMKEQT